MSRACSFGPHQTTSKSAESKEFKDPWKVESLLTDPWPNVFFSGVSPPSKIFSQFLWGSPDQNGTLSPSINTYIYRMDPLIPKIGTYLDHMDCQVKWMLYPWSSQHTIGLQDQTTSPKPQFHRKKKTENFSIWLFNRDPYHSELYVNYNPQFNCVVQSPTYSKQLVFFHCSSELSHLSYQCKERDGERFVVHLGRITLWNGQRTAPTIDKFNIFGETSWCGNGSDLSVWNGLSYCCLKQLRLLNH